MRLSDSPGDERYEKALAALQVLSETPRET
jgi:hypothetical protein